MAVPTTDTLAPWPVPDDEPGRLAALREFEILDSAPEEAFDHLVQLAATLMQAPMALVAFVEDERQWFKARIGLDVCETSRDVSFCTHAIVHPDPVMVVADASLDPRFARNPLVTEPPHIRFYASASLVTREGHRIGSICVADTVPRPEGLDSERKKLLQALAAAVMDRLEMRRAKLAHSRAEARFERMAANAHDAVVCTDGAGRIANWNPAASRLFGRGAAEVVGLPVAGVPEIGPVAAKFAELRVGGRHDKLVRVDVKAADGARVPLEVAFSVWDDGEGTCVGAIMRDVSERERVEARLRHLAHHDVLTGLPNREFLQRVIRRQLESGPDAGRSGAFVLVDIDRFKDANDTLGQAVGDAVLVEAGARLAATVRVTDTIARLGGDQFVVLLRDLEPHDAAVIAGKLVAAMRRPFVIGDRTIRLGASIGIARTTEDGTTLDDLMLNAELAMRRAKDGGGGRWCFFEPDLRARVDARRQLESELHRAFAHEEFVLHYQPQLRLSDDTIVGVEALIRWNHPDRGLLPPGQFLPVLESSALASKVGAWVLRTACRQGAIWRAQGLRSLRIGVNLSASQFSDGDLAALVSNTLLETGLPPDALELEITENIILARESAIKEPLRRLRRRGVSIAFDDFGTGYASLSHLQRFPIDRIKIDRSFVSDIGRRAEGANIVRSVIALAKSLGLKVIAEGIETADQADFLRLHGCDEAQGFFYSHPLNIADTRRRLLAQAVKIL